ncbi:conserved hypothetical protein [Sclerotinia sclerotiorum 1980 UF-70]|uniref:Probable electron transfer flavoprotein subunit alpha, mitochondrial n=1 Tax=Sclerotinia sclerotiorum (strain ATCC 18683 / 1980 / Ss-1) TaxID=665079 RepID=A7EQK2_SCLS1|nr:conserved hypothetical protein [Sclerotinia sclerotiorum 1980 UF-70]EDN91744.1 conserved hypothetical protein [Sclerotinia sclerotiorum 1980 UF-70]
MLSRAGQSILRQARTQLRPQAGPTPVASLSALARLLSSLAVLEQREGKLNHGSLGAVTAAQKLGGSITAFIAGSNIKSVAEEAAKVAGIEKIIAIDNAAYDKGLPENYAPLLVENIKKGGFTHIIAGHTAFGKNLMPRVAALLDVQQVSDITGIENEKTFVRLIYAGNAIATVESSDEIKIITIRGTAFAAAAAEGGSASIEDGVDPKVESQTEWVSEDLAKSDRPDLATAVYRSAKPERHLRCYSTFGRYEGQ